MEIKDTMDKKPRSPIVAERDDMIGRKIPDGRGDQSGPKSATGSSGTIKTLAILTFIGLILGGGFGWIQYQDLLKKHVSLQERFDLLESRLSSTDESVTQSGAAMQINISKHKDELKKHWSEIRKLWGVANDTNKTKIANNKKDISFLANKRIALQDSIKELEKKIAKESSSISDVSINYLALSEELDKANQKQRDTIDQLNRLRAALAKTDREMTNNADAIEAMDSFRRSMTRKIYELEQRPVSIQPTTKPTVSVINEAESSDP